MAENKQNKISIHLRLIPEHKEKLDELAASQNRSVTNWIETLIIEEWEKLKQNAQK
jgi:predicted transcriptional regulator